MADYVIQPKTVIVKCRGCKALYVPDRKNDRHAYGSFTWFEECPVCGGDNDYRDVIPLWRYNLIKLFRGGFRG